MTKTSIMRRKTIVKRLINFEPGDVYEGNQFSIWLSMEGEKLRQMLVDLYKRGELRIHDHTDPKQAILICKRAIEREEKRLYDEFKNEPNI